MLKIGFKGTPEVSIQPSECLCFPPESRRCRHCSRASGITALSVMSTAKQVSTIYLYFLSTPIGPLPIPSS